MMWLKICQAVKMDMLSRIIIFIIVISFFWAEIHCKNTITGKKICWDEKCLEPILELKLEQTNHLNQNGFVNFKMHDVAEVFAIIETDFGKFYYVENKGKKGLVKAEKGREGKYRRQKKELQNFAIDDELQQQISEYHKINPSQSSKHKLQKDKSNQNPFIQSLVKPLTFSNETQNSTDLKEMQNEKFQELNFVEDKNNRKEILEKVIEEKMVIPDEKADNSAANSIDTEIKNVNDGNEDNQSSTLSDENEDSQNAIPSVEKSENLTKSILEKHLRVGDSINAEINNSSETNKAQQNSTVLNKNLAPSSQITNTELPENVDTKQKNSTQTEAESEANENFIDTHEQPINSTISNVEKDASSVDFLHTEKKDSTNVIDENQQNSTEIKTENKSEQQPQESRSLSIEKDVSSINSLHTEKDLFSNKKLSVELQEVYDKNQENEKQNVTVTNNSNQNSEPPEVIDKNQENENQNVAVINNPKQNSELLEVSDKNQENEKQNVIVTNDPNQKSIDKETTSSTQMQKAELPEETNENERKSKEKMKINQNSTPLEEKLQNSTSQRSKKVLNDIETNHIPNNSLESHAKQQNTSDSSEKINTDTLSLVSTESNVPTSAVQETKDLNIFDENLKNFQTNKPNDISDRIPESNNLKEIIQTPESETNINDLSSKETLLEINNNLEASEEVLSTKNEANYLSDEKDFYSLDIDQTEKSTTVSIESDAQQRESIENISYEENTEGKSKTQMKASQENSFTNYLNNIATDIIEFMNTFWPFKDEHKTATGSYDSGLHKMLFPNDEQISVKDEEHCKEDETDSEKQNWNPSIILSEPNTMLLKNFDIENFDSIKNNFLNSFNLIVSLIITSLTILIFIFGNYFFCNRRKENELVSKLNIIERSLFASTKEAFILKHELIETKNKLKSIEDSSFGSNDMVKSLKIELKESQENTQKLEQQIVTLEKELENAAEAGLELNKMLSDLLSNQGGTDSIITSVDELQKQLNEQQSTILQINTTLAEKSKENTDLQLLIKEQEQKFEHEFKRIEKLNQELHSQNNNLQLQLKENKTLNEEKVNKIIMEKNSEISDARNELLSLQKQYDSLLKDCQCRDAKIEVLEDCIRALRKDSKLNAKEFIDSAHIKAELLASRKECDSLRERLDGELDARKLLEDHNRIISEEVALLKQEYHKSEKEKLNAITRLDVLSSYFKDKELQLQKELSLKEDLWLQQQGETRSTIERIRSMQDEIQILKSTNDSLKAEIEAQSASHKAQIQALEIRSHESWLASRQSERMLEEARAEAKNLRRKLTSMSFNQSSNDISSQRINIQDIDHNDFKNMPSPIHIDLNNSSLLGLPPPPLLPPPFLPHPFLPFMPPGEMRQPPLGSGRLMSPPPSSQQMHRYSPSIGDERDRYSDNDRYLSDSRYNYNTDMMYDSETDYSPPPSPQSRRSGGGSSNYSKRDRERNRNYKNYSPPPNSDRSKISKGSYSSSSDYDY